jgi:predicted nucleic acid-binding protein
MNKEEPKILLDSDVVIHFIKGGRQLLLAKLFPGRLVMLDKVYAEVTKRKKDESNVKKFLEDCKIPVIKMPTSREIYKEYAILVGERVGSGEAACMAVARYSRDFIASSNVTDIYDYCKTHGLVFYTTMDLLLELYKKEMLKEADCDLFIYDVKTKGSRLIRHINTIKEYEEMKKK